MGGRAYQRAAQNERWGTWVGCCGLGGGGRSGRHLSCLGLAIPLRGRPSCGRALEAQGSWRTWRSWLRGTPAPCELWEACVERIAMAPRAVVEAVDMDRGRRCFG